jgi:hypothetical protein
MSTNATPAPIRSASANRSAPEILDAFRAEFTPTGEHETFLVELMAHSRWKLVQFQTMERGFIRLFGRDCPPGADLDMYVVEKLTDSDCKHLGMVQRAAAAAERSYYKAHSELIGYRASTAPAGSRQDPPKLSANPKLQNKPNSPIAAAAPTFAPANVPAAAPIPLRASYPANLALRL